MIIIGDTHGRMELSLISKAQPLESLIQVGDFGMGFYTPKELEILNSELKKNENFLYAIRGNHDCPDYWNGKIELDLSNIQFVPDDCFLIIDEQPIYFKGGAYSIDASERIEGVSYWKDEIVTNIRPETFPEGEQCMVITHVCPSWVAPPLLGRNRFRTENDYKEYLKNVQYEREIMDELYTALSVNNTITKWFYGHFHRYSNQMSGNTQFVCIPENTGFCLY